MPTTSPLVRLDDDPSTLVAALDAAWAQGSAALVVARDAPTPEVTRGAVEGSVPLPPDTALVVLTSGSTGDARAVLLSHAALQASTAASIAALGCDPGERWALALPVRHVAGLQVLARSRALGTAPHLVAAPGDPHSIAAAADHAEHIALVPTQLVRCLEARVRLSGFRTVLVGGGPLATSRLQEAREAGVRIVLSYGMTETCGGCVYDGRALDGVEVVIGGDRRIRLRGPMLATGYLGAAPEEAGRFTADGWFITDDLGQLARSPGGETLLDVIGRTDRVINSGGVKIAPEVVETVLLKAAGVTDALVLGITDDEWGEHVRAIIVPADPSDPPGLDALRQAVTSELPPTHAPRALTLVDRIARDSLGKTSAAERDRLSRLPVTPVDAGSSEPTRTDTDGVVAMDIASTPL
jgi:o-succinylbenzoate---CoA ligase